MNIVITGRKTAVKDSFRERVQKKLAKLDRFFDGEATAAVTVTNVKDQETVEVTIQQGGIFYRAERTTDDRLLSLDAVVDVLFKQIVKNKNRLGDRLKASAFDNLEPADGPEEEEELYRLVKTKRFALKPMDVEEAILQMNMLGHNFFVFQNAEGGGMGVVYRRQGGDYGLIEPILE